jgi:Zn-dependent protease/predicted transcriptional regulator
LSLQVAKIKGIPIRLHFTLIIAFFLISWTLATTLMPQTYHHGLTIVHYWIMGILGAAILFISVLLHELAHSILALRYGIRVRQIMLFIFGGVSDMEEEEEKEWEQEGERIGPSKTGFRKEFKIAVVGPLTSFIIASVLALAWWILVQTDITGGGSMVTTSTTITTINIAKRIAEGVLQYGAVVNTLLGGFNLIPAFPLDGGRILRSALLRWKKDYVQSTKIAVRIGISISYGFMALGFMTMISGAFVSGIWILIIGWFLNSGAQSYLAQQETSSILSKIHLQDIMNTRIISAKEDMTINSLIKDYFNIYAKDSFPIVNELNYYLIGMITFKDAWNVSEDKRDIVKARDIMIPVTNLIVMQQNRTANEALIQMTRKGMGKVFVSNEEGKKLIGLVSKTDLINAIRERKDYMKGISKFARKQKQ